MFLTIENLEKYPIDKEEIEKIKILYPNGVEISTLIDDPKISSHFLDWIFSYFPIKDMEKEKYEKRFNIEESTDYFSSNNITNCYTIFNSKNCKNSGFIKNSFYIEDSHLISDSKKIKKSANIFNSQKITESYSIIESSLVHNSTRVYDSKNIYNSIDIFRSENISSGMALTNCNRLEQSFFCVNCSNSTNLMFCYRINAKDYQIFNKPVSKEEYLKISQEIFTKFDNLTCNLFTLTGNLPTSLDKGYIIYEDFSSHYKNIPTEFYDYIKTIPGFEPLIMYSITLNPIFLY